MAERERVTPQMVKNLESWSQQLTKLENVLLPGYKQRAELLTEILDPADISDSLCYEALRQLGMEPAEFNIRRFTQSEFGTFVNGTLSGIWPESHAMGYMSALENGDPSVTVAENASPNFSKRVYMLGTECYYMAKRGHSNAIYEDLKDGSQTAYMTDYIRPNRIKEKLSEVRENTRLYAAYRSQQHTPVEPEELVGVTMRVVHRLHTLFNEK